MKICNDEEQLRWFATPFNEESHSADSGDTQIYEMVCGGMECIYARVAAGA